MQAGARTSPHSQLSSAVDIRSPLGKDSAVLAPVRRRRALRVAPCREARPGRSQFRNGQSRPCEASHRSRAPRGASLEVTGSNEMASDGSVDTAKVGRPDRSNRAGARVQTRRPRGNVRWIVVLLIFIGTSIVYIDRANLSAAAPDIQDEFGLSSTELGVVLSGFFWTYAVFQLISGWFVDRVGARTSYTVAALSWSVFTAATALGRGFASLLGLRLLLGIGESPAYPTNAKVVREWLPKQERGLATGIFDSGSRVGTALSLPIVVALIAVVGWRGSFVATGLLGVVWALVWFVFYRRPQEHRRLSAEERAYIEAGQEAVQEEVRTRTRVRWIDLLKHRAAWGMVLGNFCIAFVIYWFYTGFPTYLVEGRGFDLPKLGLFGAIPALVAVPTGWLGGFCADALVRRGWSVTRARKTLIIGGLALSSCIVLSLATDSSALAIALLSVSYGSPDLPHPRAG